MHRNALLKYSRLFHLYSGVFLTPALLFFAITGGLQTFSFHETTRGSSYKPPRILVELGQLHKKQTLVVPVRKVPPPEGKPDQASAPAKPHFDPTIHGDHTNQQKHDNLDRPNRPDGSNDAAATPTPAPTPTQPQAPMPPPGRVHNLIPMKIFFVIVSIGLFLSTLTGLFMAYKYTRNNFAVTATLVAGIVIPLLLLLF